MSNNKEKNKQLVKQAQSLLKEMGYEVKTNHIYSLLAKLSGFKSWNVASAKDVDFSKSALPEGLKESEKREFSATLVDPPYIRNEIYSEKQVKFVADMIISHYMEIQENVPLDKIEIVLPGQLLTCGSDSKKIKTMILVENKYNADALTQELTQNLVLKSNNI